MSFYRKIVVDDQEYRYRVGRAFLKFRNGPLVQIPDDFGPVTPAVIKEYIEEHREEFNE